MKLRNNELKLCGLGHTEEMRCLGCLSFSREEAEGRSQELVTVLLRNPTQVMLQQLTDGRGHDKEFLGWTPVALLSN